MRWAWLSFSKLPFCSLLEVYLCINKTAAEGHVQFWRATSNVPWEKLGVSIEYPKCSCWFLLIPSVSHLSIIGCRKGHSLQWKTNFVSFASKCYVLLWKVMWFYFIIYITTYTCHHIKQKQHHSDVKHWSVSALHTAPLNGHERQHYL